MSRALKPGGCAADYVASLDIHDQAETGRPWDEVVEDVRRRPYLCHVRIPAARSPRDTAPWDAARWDAACWDAAEKG